MHETLQPGVEATAAPERLAIRLRSVRKEYKLYSSITDQAVDALGLSALRFWRRTRAQTFAALDGIDLDIRRGERVGIVGRNGAGKTTLLKLITGNFGQTAGEVEVNGEVQALMQTGVGFHSEFTGYENIRSSLIYNGLSGDEFEAALEDVIEFCELGDFLHQSVKTYSLGMRARLQFATATAIKPDILIVDEILGAGDAYFAAKSSERMKRLTSSGCTLLLVSHSNSQILQFSNRAIWVEKGRVVASGDPLEIINSYEEFIHNMADGRQGASKGAGAAADRMVDIPQWILNRQCSDGVAKGADWGGGGPLRSVRLSVVGENGDPITQIKTGQPFGLRAEIESEAQGTFPCSCLFLISDDAGDAVIRAVQPETDYKLGTDDRLTVTVWFKFNPIGRGNYLVSCGLYRGFDFRNPNRGHRYHILGRAAKLRVNSDTADDSKIIVPTEWSFESSVSKPSFQQYNNRVDVK